MAEHKIFNIPSSNSFVDTVAKKILRQYENNKLGLADVIIFVPNRRGAISFREAFIREQGLSPTILPKIVPVGDLEEDEIFLTDDGDDLENLLPAIDNNERLLIFTKIIMSKPGDFGLKEFSLAQAFSLAKDLASLIDMVYNEGLDFTNLKELVPEEYAAHWQETLKFLEIITSYWPQILKERGKTDAVQKHNLLLMLKSKKWEREKPLTHIVSAGIYADYPVIKNLLKTIYELPNGEIYLEGVDRNLTDDEWKSVDESHPQYQFKKLFDFMGIERSEIKDLIAPENKDRERFVSEIMRPAENTDKWLELKDKNFSREAFEGLRFLSCDNLRQEALAIALIMREHLEEEGATTALVCPDRNLNRMVASELERWDIEVDDSAGKPLHLMPVSIFLRQIFDVVIENFSAVSFLSLLKNPFCLCGEKTADFRKNVRDYETFALRKKDKDSSPDIEAWADKVKNMLRPLSSLISKKSVCLKDLLIAHINAAEVLASSDINDGAAYLWRGEGGRTCAEFFADMIDKADISGEIRVDEYLDFIENAMSGVSVRKQYGAHPRLKILGPVEARMNSYDYVILAEVNEGSWPPASSADPWMSRPMKQKFGLPKPEKNIGVFGLDFANLISKRNVYITRAEKADGAPTNKSRWLFRLETVLQAMGKKSEDFYENHYAQWAKLLDRADKPQRIEEPKPCPTVSLRPREFSASSLGDLIDNPYVAYAKRILHLYPLEDLDAEEDARDYGNIVHKILEIFCNRYPDKLPQNAEGLLLSLGNEFFEKSNLPESKKIFWKTRFCMAAKWFVKQEEKERENILKIVSENKGQMEINAPAGKVLLTARADRLDVYRNNDIGVVDYKTGSNVPSAKAVVSYHAPQLLLEGLIAQKGGFQKVKKGNVSALKYWKLGKNEIAVPEKDLEKIMLNGEEKLTGIIAKYDFEDMPYVVNPAPKYCKDKDYEHLSRIREWGVSSGEDDESEDDE